MSFASELNTILVATDGSPSAHEAIDFAVELAAEHEAALIFVHVVRTLDFVADDIEEDGYAVPHEPTERDHAVLEDAAARASERGVHGTTSLRLGEVSFTFWSTNTRILSNGKGFSSGRVEW